MDLQELKNMGSNPDFISGIYNYCDRWCERCYLSSRCMLCRMDDKDESHKYDDPENSQFLKDLSNIFSITLELIKEYAEEQGIDWESVPEESLTDFRKWDRKEVETNPLVIQSEDYAKKVLSFFDQYDEELNAGLADLERQSEGVEGDSKSIDKAFKINDFLRIIRWYFTMIPVKARRATDAMLNPQEHEAPIQNDMNGTAKVLSICVERSMFAWLGLRAELPEMEDESLKMLVILGKLRTMITEGFPDAQKFIRPGFDEIAS